MRVPYISANWKMNSVQDTADLPEQNYAENIINSLVDLEDCPVEVSVFCPYTHLTLMSDMSEEQFNIGAQDMHVLDKGAYTGDISADLLLDIGINHVLLGHSERREYHNETDEDVAQKLNQAINKGLYAVVCIGESDSENQDGKTQQVLQRQIRTIIADNTPVDKIVIAYEPLWAIGTGRVPSLADVEGIHKELRTYISNTYGEDFANHIRIIYGGSVNKTNASDILKLENVDGVLVGGASLHSDTFCKIIAGVQ